MTGHAGAHFAFEISEDDDRIYRKLNVKNLRRYLDRRILKGIPLAVLLCLVAALFAAFAYDLLPLSAVLSAEGAFLAAYLTAVFAGKAALSRFGRTAFRDIPPASRHFDCAFDDDAIVVKSGLRESRMPERDSPRRGYAIDGDLPLSTRSGIFPAAPGVRYRCSTRRLCNTGSGAGASCRAAFRDRQCQQRVGRIRLAEGVIRQWSR